MNITLTVPEAAATPDTIQFKLVLEGNVSWLLIQITFVSETVNHSSRANLKRFYLLLFVLSNK
jgi:hypothetical protein